MHNSTLTRSSSAKIALLCGAAMAAALANADAKVVSKFTMSGIMGGQPKEKRMTAYYKNGMMRTEGSDGQVMIMNSKKHQSFMIDPATRTYSEFNVESLSGAPTGMMGSMKMKLNAHFKNTKDKKKIVGRPAKKYIGDIGATALIPAMGQMKTSPGSMDIKMHMEQWTTTVVKVDLSPSEMMGAFGQILKGLVAGSDTKQFMKEASKIKGLPLDVDMTMTMTMHPAKGTPPPPSGTPMSFTINMNSRVQSIDEKPLPASLFQVPPGYKKTEKPAGVTRGMGRGRGGRGD